jgi:hypothetical protein
VRFYAGDSLLLDFRLQTSGGNPIFHTREKGIFRIEDIVLMICKLLKIKPATCPPDSYAAKSSGAFHQWLTNY